MIDNPAQRFYGQNTNISIATENQLNHASHKHVRIEIIQSFGLEVRLRKGVELNDKVGDDFDGNKEIIFFIFVVGGGVQIVPINFPKLLDFFNVF